MLNKVMSREAFDGTPNPRLIVPLQASIGSSLRRQALQAGTCPPDLVRRLDSAAFRTLIADLRTGIVLTWAPGGSAMRIQRDASGAVTALTIPEAPSAAGKLLSRFDSYVVSSVWESGIAIGPLRSVAPSTEPDQLMRTAMIEMATRTQSLAGCPTRYEIGPNSAGRPSTERSPPEQLGPAPPRPNGQRSRESAAQARVPSVTLNTYQVPFDSA